METNIEISLIKKKKSFSDIQKTCKHEFQKYDSVYVCSYCGKEDVRKIITVSGYNSKAISFSKEYEKKK